MFLSALDEPALHRKAAALAPALRAGDCVLLLGPLGAGKTSFARALLRAACRDPQLPVPSPTFTLVAEYEAAQTIWRHFDLYRLRAPEELVELGFDEMQHGITLIEWPERAGQSLPARHLALTLRAAGDARRDLAITASGAGWDAALAALQEAV